MFNIFKLLILFTLTIECSGSAWPSGALPDLHGGLPPAPRGQLNGSVIYSSLSNDFWKDNRTRFGLSMGLTSVMGLTVSGSNRDLSGFGAFKRGPEDMKIGLGVWPLQLANGHLRAGVNANLHLPTGFRKQELYLDSTGASGTLPAFSLLQSAGEVDAGCSWLIGEATELNIFGGTFSTSDRKEQAFRWGFSSWIAPFGSAFAAELGFTQSFTRRGDLPTTQRMTSGLAVQLPWGLKLVPGFAADLTDDPLYGAGIELRFNKLLPRSLFPPITLGGPAFQKLSGVALVPPPIEASTCTDGAQLWQVLSGQMERSFDETATLSKLDQPGLPFSEESSARFWQSVKAIGLANPQANWLVLVRVQRETVSPAKVLDVPLLASKPQHKAICEARVRVINLLELSLLVDELVSGVSKKSAALNVSIVSGSAEGLLSAASERTLMIDAYRDLAEQISFLIEEGDATPVEAPVAIQE